MKNINLKHVIISCLVVYVLGILAFLGSYYVPIMEDPDLQANIVLMAAIIPTAYFGAYLYYRRGNTTQGFVLGSVLFSSAIVLDAIITVPVFIIPNGGNHLAFFGDPGFWLIGFEYVAVVAAYWKLKVTKQAQA
ncbi:hypothetical protein GM418_13795 [Maribellus comscasis]|uniref:Uncharacterized protein n=1 Tax=Maribellus comscasis TaxID=2681766 RepID=A0A6I6JUF5_9BACT|nr:DUF5367 family protein [Maribellus comscasis]QGY44700.1 hypothetical protein GM418_13795 [Maribellus comscasis]